MNELARSVVFPARAVERSTRNSEKPRASVGFRLRPLGALGPHRGDPVSGASSAGSATPSGAAPARPLDPTGDDLTAARSVSPATRRRPVQTHLLVRGRGPVSGSTRAASFRLRSVQSVPGGGSGSRRRSADLRARAPKGLHPCARVGFPLPSASRNVGGASRTRGPGGRLVFAPSTGVFASPGRAPRRRPRRRGDRWQTAIVGRSGSGRGRAPRKPRPKPLPSRGSLPFELRARGPVLLPAPRNPLESPAPSRGRPRAGTWKPTSTG